MSPLSNPIENVDLPRQARQRFTVFRNAALKWANAREALFLRGQMPSPAAALQVNISPMRM
jgi:hypothetical protein